MHFRYYATPNTIINTIIIIIIITLTIILTITIVIPRCKGVTWVITPPPRRRSSRADST
jgi:hypothetical protein